MACEIERKESDSTLTCLHGLTDGTTRNNARCLNLNTATHNIRDRSLAVNWLPNSIKDTVETSHTDWDIHNRSGAFHNVTLFNDLVVTEDDNTDGVRLEVQRHSFQPRRAELYHLSGLDLVKTVDTCDTVSNGKDAADFIDVSVSVEALDTLIEDSAYLSRPSRFGRITSCRVLFETRSNEKVFENTSVIAKVYLFSIVSCLSCRESVRQ